LPSIAIYRASPFSSKYREPSEAELRLLSLGEIAPKKKG
jgi:hypothetical protein